MILAKLFGPGFSFTDSTELEFGIPARRFHSFENAASEAGISRFYGGIHYLPSVSYGLKVGNEIGQFIVKEIKTQK